MFVRAFGFVLVLFLILAGASAWTLRPWCDEGWFSSPARNLMEKGYMGTSVIDQTGTFRSVKLDGIDRYTYWIMPLYVLAQSAWYQVAGFSLMAMRALSMLWGVIALCAWFAILRALTADRTAALLGVALLAVDFQFVWSGSGGRMDMMAEALASTGLALYLHLRERHLLPGILAGHSCVAAAFFTHPLMLIAWAGLIVLMLALDFRRLRLFYWPLAAMPYLAGAGGWGLYIRKAPELFERQFGGNASDRWDAFASPLQAIRLEISERYLTHFGVVSNIALSSRLKVVILLAYLAGIGGCLLLPALRRRKDVRLLLLLTALYGVLIMLLDSMHQLFYLVHILPLFASLTAIWALHLLRQPGIRRGLAAGTLTALVAVQFSVAASRFRSDAYHKGFLAAAGVVQEKAAQAGIVMASAEWAFVLGFDGPLVDDWRLGYRSGKKAGLIVMDENRYQEWTSHLPEQDPGNDRYIRHMLGNEYRVIYDQRGYRIYERKE